MSDLNPLLERLQPADECDEIPEAALARGASGKKSSSGGLERETRIRN